MRRNAILLAAVATLVLVSIGGCPVQVTLRNDSGEPIHILGPGESFDPSNRLAPGDSRTIGLEPGSATFRAGSGGVVFDALGCDVPDPNSPEKLTVVYDGNLNCVTR